MNELAITIGNNIYNLRKEKKYSVKKICRIINYSIPLYNIYESGQQEPTVQFLNAIAEHYKVDIDWLFEVHEGGET